MAHFAWMVVVQGHESNWTSSTCQKTKENCQMLTGCFFIMVHCFFFIKNFHSLFVKTIQRFIECLNSLAECIGNWCLTCLKLIKLALTFLDVFLICFLKVRLESMFMPRYLEWSTIWITASLTRISGCCCAFLLLEKCIQYQPFYLHWESASC